MVTNSTPGFVFGQRPSPAQWNGYFGVKVDGDGGVFTNGEILRTSIDDSVIGAVTPQSGSFTDLTVSGTFTSTGGLSYTATGGSVARLAGDRAADVANVLDYGADPTGAIDSAAAINAAASQMGLNGHRKTVYLPTGTYRVNSQIRLTDGQTLRGDGEGSSYLLIFDNFDPAASSVIYCTGSVIDPGPTIRDLGFWFIQPNDLASRSSMLPLGGGGTSFTPGGTGVRYPWAIMAEPVSAGHGQSGRIQINHVHIQGAWNGINADNACFWIDGLKICAFNIGIAIGGTSAVPVADWAHISDVEFWTFGCWPGQANIFEDGSTIAMRIGAQNGLTAQNISCFTSRLVFTSDAASGWFSFTNLAMDGGQSSIEVAGAFFLQIANLYTTAGSPGSIRPAINVTDCQTVMISNWYAHSAGAAYNLLQVTSGHVTVTNSYLIWYTHTTDCIGVAGGGILRVADTTVVTAGTAEAWTHPLINQYDTGVLQVDNLDLRGTAGSTGVGVQMNTDNNGNYLGEVQLNAGWKNVFVGTENALGHYGTLRVYRPDKDHTSLQLGSFSFQAFAATAHNSTAFGWGALGLQQDAGHGNTAFGVIAGYGLTSGYDNCFFGFAAGYGVEGTGAPLTGAGNSCFGTNAGRFLEGGSNNVFIGNGAGINVAYGSDNIFIGIGVGGAAGTSFEMNIGALLTAVNLYSGAGAILTITGKTKLPVVSSASYADDTAAAAGGVLIDELYRNGNAVMIRLT